jgi:hypothetical protein
MKKTIFILIGAIIIIAGVALALRLSSPEDDWICTKDVWVKHGNPDSLPPLSGCGERQQIKLYYYNPKLDTDASGNVACSKNGLVPVERTISKTITPIQDTIKLLLQGEISSDEKAQGITSEFPLLEVSLTGANLKDGVLTLSFNDPQNKTSGGSCRAGILWSQVEATAKQFPEVKSVKFIPESLFQP